MADRLDADLAYLGALLGQHPLLAEYVAATQGSGGVGWPEEYIRERDDQARTTLDAVRIR